MIKNQYTSSSKLAATGGSAGGITVGMSIIEKPELFKAAVIDVGALNSLRLEGEKNSISVTEFGTASDSIEFNYLYNMDVFHHIQENKHYPSLLFTAGLNDARIGFGQTAKAVVRFQEVSINKSNIVLFKIGENGHAGDSDGVKQLLDSYSFLLWQLNRQ